MRNLLYTIILTAFLFSCQKSEDISPLAVQESKCDCFNPLEGDASWEYKVTYFTFEGPVRYDESGNMQHKKKNNWTTYSINSGELKSPHENNQMFHVRHLGNNAENAFNTKYFQQIDNEYFTLDKMFLKDAPVGTAWKINKHNTTRVIIDRHETYSLDRTYNDVIEVHEIKNYNNGDEYVLSKEFYAKNIGLIYSEDFTYDNYLVGLKKTSLMTYNN